MNETMPSIYYIGEEPFSERLIKALFARKSRVVGTLKDGLTSNGASVMLADSLEQLKNLDGKDGYKVLMKNSPVPDHRYHLWCKTPLNENAIDNILFYHQQRQMPSFISTGDHRVRAQKLESFIGNDRAHFHEVIAEFIDNTSTNLRLLHQAFAQNNLTETGEIAHRMLSSISYYDVGPVRDTLKILEYPADHEQNVLGESLDSLGHYITALRSGLIREYF